MTAAKKILATLSLIILLLIVLVPRSPPEKSPGPFFRQPDSALRSLRAQLDRRGRLRSLVGTGNLSGWPYELLLARELHPDSLSLSKNAEAYVAGDYQGAWSLTLTGTRLVASFSDGEGGLFQIVSTEVRSSRVLFETGWRAPGKSGLFHTRSSLSLDTATGACSGESCRRLEKIPLTRILNLMTSTDGDKVRRNEGSFALCTLTSAGRALIDHLEGEDPDLEGLEKQLEDCLHTGASRPILSKPPQM